MDSAFNADFSGIRVHSNSEAGALNRELNARAFTTGRDIFFREGEYNPGSTSGKELIAHELTHVVQQNGEKVSRKTENQDTRPGSGGTASPVLMEAIQGKLTVGHPGDIYEQEADETAKAFSIWQQRGSQSATTGSGLRRQDMKEENEQETKMRTKLMGNSLLRQPEGPENEEEEKTRLKLKEGGIQRQSAEEEELD